jgi:streptomycin 6-kinase
LETIHGQTGYVHGDLYGENVIRLAEGYRVIDWQRPLWGPVALDRVVLLESLGVDPTGQVTQGAILLRRLLLIDWFAQAARTWFPAGNPTYDREIARLVEEKLK